MFSQFVAQAEFNQPKTKADNQLTQYTTDTFINHPQLLRLMSKSVGPVKRFGVRYGRTLRSRLAKIEILQKKSQLCPYCFKTGVKRLSFGIWECSKCTSKFTHDAFFLPSMIPQSQRMEEAAE